MLQILGLLPSTPLWTWSSLKALFVTTQVVGSHSNDLFEDNDANISDEVDLKIHCIIMVRWSAGFKVIFSDTHKWISKLLCALNSI